MDLLDNVIFGNSLRSWLFAAGIGLAAILALQIAQSIISRRLQALAARTETRIDDLFSDLVSRTRKLFLLLVGVFLGSLSLDLPAEWELGLRTTVIVALWVQAGFWGMGVVRYFIRTRLEQERSEEDAVGATTVSALGAVASAVLWAIVILMALDNIPGVEVTALLASLGVGGIAVALALQNILGDLFASLAIALDKPFVIGDFIIVDEYVGTVEKIGLKTTRIRSLSGEQIIFSNSDLLNSRVRNYKVMYERRVMFHFGVVYQTAIDAVQSIGGIVAEIIEAVDHTRFDRAHFSGFGDSSLDFEVVYYVLTSDYNEYMDIQERINLAIMRRFEQQGIEFAYPTQTVFVESNTGPAGAAPLQNQAG